MKKISIILMLLLACVFTLNAQDNEEASPNFYATSTSMRVTPSLESRTNLIPALDGKKEMLDGRSIRNKVVPGQGSTGDDILAKKQQDLTEQIQGRDRPKSNVSGWLALHSDHHL